MGQAVNRVEAASCHLDMIQVTGSGVTGYEKRLFDSVAPLDTLPPNELLSLARQSKTATPHSHTYDRYRPDADWQKSAIVELARVSIPDGDLGILRRIDTLVLDDTTNQPISGWDNPSSWDNVFKFAIGYNQYNDKTLMTGRYIAETHTDDTLDMHRYMPAVPLWPITDWNDDRFAWGNPSNKMSIPIPGGIVVRLFVFCKELTAFRHTVQGQLVATTQTADSLSAAWKARRGNHG